MDIVRKARAVEKLFKSLEKDIAKLQSQTGIHCIENCIKCCTTPKIVATALEFYPFALHLYYSGQAESFLATIELINNQTICPVLENLSIDGSRIGCKHYDYRGLICRLFAYNHTTDKYGRRRVAACKSIQLDQPESISKANTILAQKPLGPKASNYYSRLQFIDFTESQQLYPIGEAIRIAIETVVTYFHYRGKKAV